MDIYKRNSKFNYLLKNFDEEIIFYLKDFFYDNEELSITSIILEFLPDYKNRRRWRTITKSICHQRFIMVIWYRDPEIAQPPNNFVVKRECRDFMKLLFNLLCELEDSTYTRTIYRYILKLLEYKHTHLLVVHHEYIMVDDVKIDVRLSHALSFYL